MTELWDVPDPPNWQSRAMPPAPSTPDGPLSDADNAAGVFGGIVAAPANGYAVQLGEIFRTARKAAEADSVAAGRVNMAKDATAQRIAKIQEAWPGVDIPDPWRGGYTEEATAAYKANPGKFDPDNPDPTGARRIHEARLDAFQQRLEDLTRERPDLADVIGAKRPIGVEAAELANRSVAEAAAAMRATDGVVMPFLASLAGGLAGSLRDPVNQMALFATGGSTRAASLAGKIAEGALRQGVVNVGVAAAGEPDIAKFRAERGQPHGLGQTAEDLGMAFLFGAVPGGAMEAGKAALAWRAGRAGRGIAGRGETPASTPAAAPEPAPELHPDVHQAVEGSLADAAAAGPLPEGLPADKAADLYRGALRHAEDPQGAPPPEIAAPVRPETTDEAARAALAHGAADLTPYKAVERLREKPELVESALASADPALERAGRLAALPDEAWALVRRGDLEPQAAADIAARIADPAEAAPILARVAELRPQDTAEALAHAGEAIEQTNLRRALGAVAGEEVRSEPAPPPREGLAAFKAQAEELAQQMQPPEPSAAAPAPSPARKRWRETDERALPSMTLTRFLAADRGLRFDADIASIFGRRNPFVPGMGPLFRPNGRKLDDALRAAIEAGYFHEPGDHSAGPAQLAVRDLLDAIYDEQHGSPRYVIGQSAEEAAAFRKERAQERRMTAEVNRDLRAGEKIVRKAVGKGEQMADIPADVWRQAASLHVHDGMEPVTAFDHAVLDWERRTLAASEQNHAVRQGRIDDAGDEIPFWDHDPDGGPAPRDGAAPAGGTGDAAGAAPRTGEPGAAARDAGAPAGDAPASGAADGGLTRAPPDLLDQTPVARPDGTVDMVSRDGLTAEPRENYLANVIQLCEL